MTEDFYDVYIKKKKRAYHERIFRRVIVTSIHLTARDVLQREANSFCSCFVCLEPVRNEKGD